jgi:hypothetical protein
MSSSKKISITTKQTNQSKVFNELVGGKAGYSILNYKSINKENKGVKSKQMAKSNEKIGPKIISKYSVGKYQSNFDDLNLDDSDPEEIKGTLEQAVKFDGAELARTLRKQIDPPLKK